MAEGLSKTRRMMFMYIILLKKKFRFDVILVFEIGHFKMLAEKWENLKIFIGFSMKISKIENFRKTENRKSRFSIFRFSIFRNFSTKIFRFFDFSIFRKFRFFEIFIENPMKIFRFSIFDGANFKMT